jgi:ParB family chromosome partitioning protein
MKSHDYPGKQKPGLAGFRKPAEIPQNNASAARGRAAMLSKVSDEPEPKALENEGVSGTDVLQEIDVDNAFPTKYQPRLIFNAAAIEELANSIAEIGLVKPILVRPLADGRFEIIGGERRWRAVKILGWKHIQAVVKDMTDDVAMLLALADNEHEPLTDYELAVSYHRYLKTGKDKSQRAIARRLGVDHTVVSRCLDLMKLSPTIRQTLDSNPGLITANFAKKFVDLAEEHHHIVERQVLSMAEKGLGQVQVLRLIAQEIVAITHKATAALVPTAVKGIGTLKVSGQKLELKCEKGIDPNRLLNQFEAFLKSVDRSSLTVESN